MLTDFRCVHDVSWSGVILLAGDLLAIHPSSLGRIAVRKSIEITATKKGPQSVGSDLPSPNEDSVLNDA